MNRNAFVMPSPELVRAAEVAQEATYIEYMRCATALALAHATSSRYPAKVAGQRVQMFRNELERARARDDVARQELRAARQNLQVMEEYRAREAEINAGHF